jgi:hypothetical protein
MNRYSAKQIFIVIEREKATEKRQLEIGSRIVSTVSAIQRKEDW